MTQIVVNFGGFSWSKTYVGPPNEIVADTDNHDLLLQDGATPGGFRFLNRDNADARYQKGSPELTGLALLPEGEKGILFRRGTAAYRIGKLEVNPASLALSNPDGFDGNPIFSLAATVASSHIWEGTHTFQNAITFLSGIVGDVEGNVTGNVLGNVTGNVLGNVNGDLTGDSQGNHFGGLDARGSELLFDVGQIPQAAVAGLVGALAGLVIPNRIPHLWWGAVEDIPAGWLLCDGTQGTPDLRGRFAIGASAAFLAGSIGGNSEHIHGAIIDSGGAHQHAVTVEDTVLDLTQIPNHRHLNGVTDDSATQNPFNRGFVAANPPGTRGMDDVGSAGIHEGRTEAVGGGQGHAHGASSESSGNHAHGATIESRTHIPPYMAFHYIIRL